MHIHCNCRQWFLCSSNVLLADCFMFHVSHLTETSSAGILCMCTKLVRLHLVSSRFCYHDAIVINVWTSAPPALHAIFKFSHDILDIAAAGPVGIVCTLISHLLSSSLLPSMISLCRYLLHHLLWVLPFVWVSMPEPQQTQRNESHTICVIWPRGLVASVMSL